MDQTLFLAFNNVLCLRDKKLHQEQGLFTSFSSVHCVPEHWIRDQLGHRHVTR